MISRRQPPVKQNPQSFLHPPKIAENRRKTQKRCKFNLQIGCGFYPFRLAAARQSTFPKGTALGGGDKVSGSAIRRPLGGAGERSETEGVLGLAGAAPHPALRVTFPRRVKASAVAGTSPVSPEAPSQRELARRKPRLREFFPLKNYAKNSAFRRVL